MSDLLNSSKIVKNENIGGFPFIMDYLNIYIPYSVLSAIGVIVGVIGIEKFLLQFLIELYNFYLSGLKETR